MEFNNNLFNKINGFIPCCSKIENNDKNISVKKLKVR